MIVGIFGSVGLIIIGGVLMFVSIILILLTRCILFCNTRALFGKIAQSIERCNLILRKYGYYAQFPLISKNWLFCIPCCGCYNRLNWDLIEIYDENSSRKKEIGIAVMNNSAKPMYNIEGGNTA